MSCDYLPARPFPAETPFSEVQVMAFRIVGQQEMGQLADTLARQEFY
jgi:hypothetical protein